jgi:hypothetical protein
MKIFMLKPGASNRMNGEGVNRLVVFGLLALMLFAACPTSTVNAADTRMKHTPPDYFVSEHRMQLDADVRDPGGINLVRLYFKAAGEADLVFVPMSPAGSNKYAGILPAPSATTDQIEYLFLAVNAANQVVRSQTFYIYKNDAQKKPAWQDIPKDGEIRVSMELDKAPTELRGFSDNVTIDIVESGARFGVVALLYDASQSKGGGAGAGGEAATATSAEVGMTGTAAAATSAEAAGLTGAAATATSAGTITAGTVGFSTTALVAAGVVGAAAVGGGVAAASSSSGGGGSSPEDLTEKTIAGNWSVTGSHTGGATTNGNFTYIDNGSYTYNFSTIFSDNSTSETSGSGTWTLDEDNLILNFDAGAVYNGIATGDSSSFTMVSTNGWTLNFSRK